MSSDYIAPMFQVTGFNCPYCGVFAHQRWSGIVRFTLEGYEIDLKGVDVSQCERCRLRAIWVEKELIFPESTTAPLANSDMPEDVLEDYNEAAEISHKSPRAAAALLRLAVQKLCIKLGEIGEHLDTDIGNLVKKGLPHRIQQALDIVRVIGNNAVHPGEIDLKDDQETCSKLFKLLNLIVQDRISEPKEIEELYKKLPDGQKEHIEKRDAQKP